MDLVSKGRLLLTGMFLVVTVFNAGTSARTAERKERGASDSIPLSSIYASWPHQGLKQLNRGVRAVKNGKREYVQPYGEDLQRIYEESRQGISNIFLVRGTDITAAIKATREVFLEGRSVDMPPAVDERQRSNELWLVAYFGIAESTPAPWIIRSVQRNGRTIRVTFEMKQPDAAGPIVQRGLVWVPVGKVEPGVITLELFEVKSNAAVLTRRVSVSDKKS